MRDATLVLVPSARSLHLVGAISTFLLAVPIAAHAQLRPGVDDPVDASWGPSAVVRTDADGLVVRAYGLAIATEGRDPTARAVDFLTRYQARLALGDPRELTPIDAREAHGLTTVRFVRQIRGMRVGGASAVVRFAGDRVDYVDLAHLRAEIAWTPRTLDVDGASAIALHPGERVREAREALLTVGDEVRQVVVVDSAGLHLADRRRTVVDAVDGTIIAAHSLTRDAQGRVYASNPNTDMNMTSDVELLSLTSRDRITGRFFRVFNCNFSGMSCDPMQLAVADTDGNFLYDPEEPAFDDPFAEVNMYFHANQIAEYFRDTHDLIWQCGAETIMRVFVNYSEGARVPYDNAAYSPSGGTECGFLLFGQGQRDYSYDSDVVFHEFTHAVVDQISSLGFFFADPQGVSYEPQAINEATADYFAASVNGDPHMAEYFSDIPGGSEGSLRSLDNAYVCPNDLVGEPHYDGRIWAAAAWDLHEAIGAAKTDALMFASVAAASETSSLAEMAETTRATAMALATEGVLDAADVATVESTLAARGLTDCTRVVPLDDGEFHLAYSGQGQISVAAGGGIAPVMFRIDVPADATSLRLSLVRVSPAGTFSIHSAADVIPRYRAAGSPQIRADDHLTLDAEGRVVWMRDGTPTLPRCSTLYIAVITEDLATIGGALFEMRAQLERDGTETSCDPIPDAGVSGADASVDASMDGEPRGGGCGCRTAAPRGSSSSWMMLGTALALLARRRRYIPPGRSSRSMRRIG
ncbi:MAG: MYXO-CTERM sorting domain-containing protein [Sandaracinaceae bacterium]